VNQPGKMSRISAYTEHKRDDISLIFGQKIVLKPSMALSSEKLG
jgi:hypothetical protein